MKSIKLKQHVVSNFASILLISLALLSSVSSAMAGARSIDTSNTAVSDATAQPGLNYQTHDNGNYHRYHVDNTIQHMQIPGKKSDSRKDNRDRNIAGRRNIGLRSDYRFRRYDRNHLELGIYDHDYNRRYSSSHRNRKFLNTLIGGSVVYYLLK